MLKRRKRGSGSMKSERKYLKMHDLGYTNYKNVKVRAKEHPGEQVSLEVRSSLVDFYLRTINLKKSRRTITEDLPKLHQQLLPIDSKMLKRLLELCHNNDIPEICHNFYFSLKSKETIRVTNFEAEENITDTDDENSSDCE
ncbi:hypothetical protein ILUMI_10684 [Ignelater luminosus]|uniref:Uncharacterized protein n=1 Tax=Ignelater luminosus TaxID=2038154 RepID=A0A8K0D3G0_IGNLU|nr:hypothetical protein ILUMI_10684 [Ignelater luminosus]